MPDIEKINNVTVADISKLDAVTFAHGQKVNNQSVSLVTDAHTLIATATSDGSDSSLGFTSGIDSTYDVYEFVFTNIHPETDTVNFGFQVSTGTGFDQLEITSTYATAYHVEDDSGAALFYDGDYDQAEGTAYQVLARDVGTDDDESASGILTLYAPSSGTYVKNFMATVSSTYRTGYQFNNYIAGYIDTTTAITQIDFKFASDEIQGGEIKMYGLATS